MTTCFFTASLYRALLAIDPQLRRRRYERAVQGRSVALYLDPRAGTATLTGDGLPAHEAAAAAARLDRLAEAAKRAGHPRALGQLSSDLFLGMLNGEFHGLTENEIIDRLLGIRRPEDDPAADSDSDSDSDSGAEVDAADDARATGCVAATQAVAETTQPGTGSPEQAGAAAGSGDANPGDEPSNPDERGSPEQVGGTGESESAEKTGSTGATGDRWTGERVATRDGIEIRAGLGTLAGLDERPGEIPGLGPVGAHVAREAATGQQRGAHWLFAIVDTHGHLLLAGPLRRRPRTGTRPPPVRGGTVEMHLTLDELQRYTADPALTDWHLLLAEIAHAWNDRDQHRKRLTAHPSARFARGPLADHIRVRDRTCIGPGCTRAARRSDLDHTRDHSRGGRTLQDNIGPACARHHADKDRGWALTQPTPGLFRWVSPLGRIYWIRGEPVRPDLPDPDPTEHPSEHPGEETAAQVDQRLRDHNRRIMIRPLKDPPRSPAPEPDPPPNNDPPQF